MLGLLLFGAVLPSGLPRSATLTAITFFTLLFVIRMAIVGSAWVGHRDDIADIRTVITTVEPGARVFVTAVSPEEAPGYWQDSPLSRQLSNGIRVDYDLAALLLIERSAFWPFLFDNPSQQPVETLPPYRAMAEGLARSRPWRACGTRQGRSLRLRLPAAARSRGRARFAALRRRPAGAYRTGGLRRAIPRRADGLRALTVSRQPGCSVVGSLTLAAPGESSCPESR